MVYVMGSLEEAVAPRIKVSPTALGPIRGNAMACDRFIASLGRALLCWVFFLDRGEEGAGHVVQKQQKHQLHDDHRIDRLIAVAPVKARHLLAHEVQPKLPVDLPQRRIFRDHPPQVDRFHPHFLLLLLLAHHGQHKKHFLRPHVGPFGQHALQCRLGLEYLCVPDGTLEAPAKRFYRCFSRIESWFASTGAPSFSPAGSIENMYLFHQGPAAQ